MAIFTEEQYAQIWEMIFTQTGRPEIKKPTMLIDMDAPCLSLNDLISVWNYGDEFPDAVTSPMFKSFQQLAIKKQNTHTVNHKQ